MEFELISRISEIETIAFNRGIRELARLRKLYGKGRWRKLKGVALVRLQNGRTHRAEIHWYEANGIGRRDLKIKRLLDEQL